MKSMAKQMDMFDDGGLMDEGGTVDPVSGNDVPPGSTQEEVRDDIPAQLSEGEFVFPADVVRYFGLEKLMEMRQEAKMGLQRMEDMGQMGNSEEAIMPDNLPFTLDDLEMEEDQSDLNFNLGGVVPMQGTGVVNTANAGPTTGFTPYVAPAIPGFTGPQLQNTQYTTATQTTNLPTFLQTVGTKPGEYDELRRYVNDAGQVRQIPFKNGQPIYPIPEGYRFEAEGTTGITTPTTMPTTTVGQQQDDGGGGDGDGGVGVGAGTSVSGYPGRTGVEGLKSAFSNFGSYDTTTPPSENPYGVTGQRGINLGALASIATGIPGLGSLVDSEMGLFGYGPSAGFPGGNVDTSTGLAGAGVRGMSRSDLEGIMSGAFSPSDYDDFGFGVTASQARAAVSAANVLGLETITGVYGYKKGDAIAGVKDGFIDSKGVGRNVATGELNGHYEDVGSFIDRMTMTRADKDKADAAAGQAAVANTMATQQAAQAARTAARRGSDSTPGDTPSSNTSTSPSTGKGVASGNYGQDMGPHGGDGGNPGGGGGLDGNDGGSTEGSESVGDG